VLAAAGSEEALLQAEAAAARGVRAAPSPSTARPGTLSGWFRRRRHRRPFDEKKAAVAARIEVALLA
jgi:hypothetical protein